MKKWRVSRTFCERISWIVEAENEAQALEALNEPELTPDLEGDEQYLGPFESLNLSELQDDAEELKEEEK